jgi:hypothetical protein
MRAVVQAAAKKCGKFFKLLNIFFKVLYILKLLNILIQACLNFTNMNKNLEKMFLKY